MNTQQPNTLQIGVRELSSYLLTGPDSKAVLAAAGLPLPEAVLSAEERPGALVARTGRDEYMAMLAGTLPVPQGEWCFRRYDCVFELTGVTGSHSWHTCVSTIFASFSAATG